MLFPETEGSLPSVQLVYPHTSPNVSLISLCNTESLASLLGDPGSSPRQSKSHSFGPSNILHVFLQTFWFSPVSIPKLNLYSHLNSQTCL